MICSSRVFIIRFLVQNDIQKSCVHCLFIWGDVGNGINLVVVSCHVVKKMSETSEGSYLVT